MAHKPHTRSQMPTKDSALCVFFPSHFVPSRGRPRFPVEKKTWCVLPHPRCHTCGHTAAARTGGSGVGASIQRISLTPSPSLPSTQADTSPSDEDRWLADARASVKRAAYYMDKAMVREERGWRERKRMGIACFFFFFFRS